jgi:hypothetical protein
MNFARADSRPTSGKFSFGQFIGGRDARAVPVVVALDPAHSCPACRVGSGFSAPGGADACRPLGEAGQASAVPGIGIFSESLDSENSFSLFGGHFDPPPGGHFDPLIYRGTF